MIKYSVIKFFMIIIKEWKKKLIFSTIKKIQIVAFYFNVIFNLKPIFLFWSIQSMIMISILEYIAHFNTFINIYRIKTYPYEYALQTNKMLYQSSLKND